MAGKHGGRHKLTGLESEHTNPMPHSTSPAAHTWGGSRKVTWLLTQCPTSQRVLQLTAAREGLPDLGELRGLAARSSLASEGEEHRLPLTGSPARTLTT